MDLRFHPDKNWHSQVTEVMKIINEAKEKLEITLCHNDDIREEERFCMDAMREEERVCMAQNDIIISCDDKYYSGRRQIPSKPVTSSNKSSTYPAKHKSDNEETPVKKTHQGSFTSKQETLEIINWLHIKCGFLDTENLFMLPKTWLEYLQYEEVDVEISENLYNANCTSKYFLLRNISRVGIPSSW